MLKTILAVWPCKCARCGLKIHVGDWCKWRPPQAEMPSAVFHQDCSPEAEEVWTERIWNAEANDRRERTFRTMQLQKARGEL